MASSAHPIAEVNGRRSGGIASPMSTFKQKPSSKLHLGETPFAPRETFRGRSFLLPVLVEFLARRLNGCSPHSGTTSARSIVPNSPSIERRTSIAGTPRQAARTRDAGRTRRHGPTSSPPSNSPAAQDMFLTREFVPLVMPFSLVYPHRFTSGLAYLAETRRLAPPRTQRC